MWWRWPVRTLAGIAVIAAAGIVFQVAGDAIDGLRYPPPGRLVDVGGYRLHLQISGDAGGGTTFVLESGPLAASPEWGHLAPQLSRLGRVVSYDRPGLGWSDASPQRLAPRELAQALHTALARAGVPPPYVVVAHSAGALFAEELALAYARDVTALVLIDPIGADMQTLFGPDVVSDRLAALNPLAVAGRLGIVRASQLASRLAAGLPRSEHDQAVALLESSHHLAGALPDARIAEAAVRELHGRTLGDLPLLVVSGTETDPFFFPDKRNRDLLNDLQAEMKKLSTRGDQKLILAADHLGILTDVGYARAVGDVIRAFVTQLRTK